MFMDIISFILMGMVKVILVDIAGADLEKILTALQMGVALK